MLYWQVKSVLFLSINIVGDSGLEVGTKVSKGEIGGENTHHGPPPCSGFDQFILSDEPDESQ